MHSFGDPLASRDANCGFDLSIDQGAEAGQFYKRHHDQNTAVWAPQGPRVLTFFMYLNEVGGGGEIDGAGTAELRVVGGTRASTARLRFHSRGASGVTRAS